jgi:hypothetical protein
MSWQPLQLPFAAGLNQKADPRALPAPELLKCYDGQFDELGGIQTRKPLAEMGIEIDPSTNVENFRRIVSNGNELLAFSKDSLYSWNAQAETWVSRGTHLAVKTEEATVFATTGDQTDCDRAELGGTIFYSWMDGPTAPAYGYVAAIDSVTGSVLMAPTLVSGYRIRLTALTTKVLLSYYDGVGGIYAYALDPADPATALAGAPVTLCNGGSGGVVGPYHDVARVPGADQAAFVVSEASDTQYVVGTVTAALTVARSAKARNSTNVVAISVDPTGAQAQVVRVDSGIKGDLITLSTLADVFTAQAIGTLSGTCAQIAACHRSTQDSAQYRCYVYWTGSQDDTTASWTTKYNWVNTGGTLGTQATFVTRAGVTSRAFDHEGRIFVWLAFGGAAQYTGAPAALYQAELQNTFFLYRDDAFLCAKACAGRAAGFSESQGFLGGVQSTDDGYAWCGGESTRLNLSNNVTNYSAREPKLVRVNFDSNEARRCVRLGRTLYITGGEILQYDGRQLTEVGFHLFPWNITNATQGASGLADGVYAYKASYRWMNAAGETERSAAPVTVTTTVSGGPKQISVQELPELNVTHKADRPVAIEVWRTAVNPTTDAPYYLITSPDPNDVAATANEYLQSAVDGTVEAVVDEMADATAIAKETNPENGGFIENIAPPAATIIAASVDRIFLAGVAGDPDRIWYSKLRNEGEVVAFHESLTASIPHEGGAITGLGFLNETLVVFRETAVYALPGEGYDNTGGGQNYGPARIISAEVGAENHESVALEPGGLVFQSSKGKYRVNRGWALEYIGGPVSDYDDEEVLAVHVVESQHQIRWVTGERVLVHDYLAGQWSEWTIADSVHACLWRSQWLVLKSDGGPYRQCEWDDADAQIAYGLDVETAWIKMNDLQGACRVRRFLILGEYRGAHYLRVRVARDYATTYFDDVVWTVSPTTVGGPEQVKHGPSIQQCQAFKVRISAASGPEVEGVVPPATTEALKLTGLGLEVGIRPGLHRRIPVAQKSGE